MVHLFCPKQWPFEGGTMLIKTLLNRMENLAHDDKLWVAAPGLEFIYARSAGLNDLELLELFVPVSIGSTYDVLGLLVG